MKHSSENHAKWQLIVMAAMAIAMLLAGCGGDAPSGETSEDIESSSVVIAPDCIQPAGGRALGETYSGLECLGWTYDDGHLWLTHSNATYNCCLDSVSINMLTGEQTITIIEMEHLEGGGCHCLCQYNLDFHVADVTPGQYTLLLLSNNGHSGGVELLFEISLDLVATPSGTFCLED